MMRRSMMRRRISSGNGGGQFKKLLKMNGITKFPSGTEFKDRVAKWYKRGGYAGEKTLSNIRAQLKDAGWSHDRGTQGGTPDGSAVGNGDIFFSPDG